MGRLNYRSRIATVFEKLAHFLKEVSNALKVHHMSSYTTSVLDFRFQPLVTIIYWTTIKQFVLFSDKQYQHLLAVLRLI